MKINLPLLVHLRIGVQIIVPQLGLRWSHFKGEFLPAHWGWLDFVALQTSHTWNERIWFSIKSCELSISSLSYQLSSYYWHRNRNTDKHPWGRNTVSTMSATCSPISSNTRHNLASLLSWVLSSNCVCLFLAMHRSVWTHGTLWRASDWPFLPCQQPISKWYPPQTVSRTHIAYRHLPIPIR